MLRSLTLFSEHCIAITSRSADWAGATAKAVAMSLSQGAIEGIKKGDIANEPVKLKVNASLSRSAVMARNKRF